MLPGWIRFFRLVFGMLALVAVFKNYVDLDEDHFWHFFTNQSSLLAGVVLVLGATVFTRRRSPLAWDITRGTAVMMMLTTGIVYAVLLDGVYNPFDGSHRWPSSVMHQLLPIVMLCIGVTIRVTSSGARAREIEIERKDRELNELLRAAIDRERVLTAILNTVDVG